MSDNKIFNVNGQGKEFLAKTISLAMGESKAVSWEFSPANGLVFNWSDTRGVKLPSAIDAAQVTELAWAWLQSEEALEMSCENWDANIDMDGDTEKGWRVYVGDWGHVGDNRYAILAVRFAWIWYGK